MTYEEQLKIEELNRSIINNIVDNVGADKFINFYLNHNQKETMQEFGIRTTKQLTKILKLFNYDFSKPKPSLLKNKPAVRSHDSYIAGGKKSSDTQKATWAAKTVEDMLAWSEKQKAAHATDTYKANIKSVNDRYREDLDEGTKLSMDKRRSESMKKYLSSLTEEEFTAWINRGFRLYTADTFYFDSFPELCFYLYHKHLNHNIVRSSKQLEYFYNNEKHYYLPDFELDGQLYEIKGDHLFARLLQPDTIDNAKYLCMLNNNVIILQSKDYTKYEDWFITSGFDRANFYNK